MQHSLYKIDDIKKASGEVELASDVLNTEMNDDLVWQVVNSIKHQRITTKKTKNRSDANGGGKKPWRQKGTGRARAGTSRSPIWVGGGITFSHESRVCTHKINKKMYRKAVAAIISEFKKQDKLVIIDEIKASTHKTKDLAAKIQPWLDQRKVLVLTESLDANFLMASRNLYQICYGEWGSVLCPELLVNSNLLVVSKQAITEIQGWLK